VLNMLHADLQTPLLVVLLTILFILPFYVAFRMKRT